MLKNWGIHSVAESSTVHKVNVALRWNTGGVRVFCGAARPTIQKLCWEESDRRIPDCCGHSENQGACGAVWSIII